MRCPFCSATEDKVVDTRPSEDEQIVRRRRECAGCGKRFTTYERVESCFRRWSRRTRGASRSTGPNC